MIDGRDHIGEKAIHRQQVRDPAPRVAEFTGRQALSGRLDRQQRDFPAADLPRSFILCFPPSVEKVRCAFLVPDVVQRASRNQHDHD